MATETKEVASWLQEDDAGVRRELETATYFDGSIPFVEEVTAVFQTPLYTYRVTCTKRANELIWSNFRIRPRTGVR